MQKKYLLAIKRANNDYLPLEWNCLSIYEGENLNTLEGIDNFTTKQNTPTFIETILKEQLAEENEKFEKFVILYIENNNKRELKTIFEEEKEILNFELLTQFLYANADNKNFMNQIYTMCSSKKSSQTLHQFAYIIKNISNFALRGQNAVYAALLQFNNLPYEEKRKISILIHQKYIVNTNQNNNRLIKKDKI